MTSRTPTFVPRKMRNFLGGRAQTHICVTIPNVKLDNLLIAPMEYIYYSMLMHGAKLEKTNNIIRRVMKSVKLRSSNATKEEDIWIENQKKLKRKKSRGTLST